MKPVLTSKEAVKIITDGMSVMIGGFLNIGTPLTLVDALAEQGSKDLTLISCTMAYPGQGVGKLQDRRQFSKLIASWIGGHPDTGKLMETGELEVVLTPQGTLAEQIRAGGAGLGGFLTPTGVGTVVAKGKQEYTIHGKTYLLEYPLTADVALVKAYKADTDGNLLYRLSARNFNPLMAMAATIVIAEVEEVVPVGTFDPDQVVTPGIFVDILVKEGNEDDCRSSGANSAKGGKGAAGR
ncbi:CoA transferase subunit A [Zhaonella formicivorans]|uniref:CoA transferase subunit A n=1 Tax=Zhaonella formicivorans TaxID=2528593 RepID=UPI0010E73656|nr:CoA transferase subunit A [Zhaonella formicivorans]